MTNRQQLFILMILSKLAMLGTLYFGFWVFIYEIAWWNKPILFAFMSSGVSLVLCMVCFMAWSVLEMWIKDPSTMPVFRIERGKKTAKSETQETTQEGEKKPKEERLPVF